MKKLLLVVVVVALALTLVPLALAGPGGGMKHGHAKFNLVGKVTAVTIPVVDPTAEPTVPVDPSTIGIFVKAGSHIKDIRGKDTPFVVPAEAKIWQLTEDGAVVGELGMIAAGDKVMVKGRVAEGVYTIKSIKYIDRTPDAPPAPDPVTP